MALLDKLLGRNTMTRPTRIEVDCTTGVESIIELTDAEITQMEVDAQAYAARKAEEDAALAAAETAKASAQAKLTALGLTAEEISALSK
jgi:molybdopterin-binding protein